MTDDAVLSALALLELVDRVGPQPFADFAALAGAECEHVGVSLYLAGVVVKMAEQTSFPLTDMIEAERAAVLQHDEG